MDVQIVGITALRDQARQVLDQVVAADVVVLRHNRAVARLVHPDRFEKLLQRIEALEDALAAHGIDPDGVRWVDVDDGPKKAAHSVPKAS